MEEVRNSLFSMEGLKAPGSRWHSTSLLSKALGLVVEFVKGAWNTVSQHLIGPFQNSFLAGRSTTDNTLVTQEVVHSIMNMRGIQGAMILKIDLQNAYDNVDWSFLRFVLIEFGLSCFVSKLVKSPRLGMVK
ncbi:hypothetical protein J1N35_028044 [Gossypium stocksii]|uniref:Reverse transcriptase domain-containing protein n=1 Tax=Gossypium stocksii TaxID=47602 RepID=A0A9D3UVI2_9ROSI|nr:hypothetical protein J1N35_028044 [Gossypium stocksii]